MSPLGSLGSPQTPALPGRKSLLAEPWGVGGGTFSDHHCSPHGSHVAQMVKNLPANSGNAGDESSIPGSGRFLYRRKWQNTTVFLPGEPHRQRNLAGHRPQGHKNVRHDWAHTPACTPAPTEFLFQPWPLKLFLVAVLIIIVCSNQSGRLRSNNKKVIINIDKDSSNEKNDWSAFQGRQGSQNTES